MARGAPRGAGGGGGGAAPVEVTGSHSLSGKPSRAGSVLWAAEKDGKPTGSSYEERTIVTAILRNLAPSRVRGSTSSWVDPAHLCGLLGPVCQPSSFWNWTDDQLGPRRRALERRAACAEPRGGSCRIGGTARTP